MINLHRIIQAIANLDTSLGSLHATHITILEYLMPYMMKQFMHLFR